MILQDHLFFVGNLKPNATRNRIQELRWSFLRGENLNLSKRSPPNIQLALSEGDGDESKANAVLHSPTQLKKKIDVFSRFKHR